MRPKCVDISGHTDIQLAGEELYPYPGKEGGGRGESEKGKEGGREGGEGEKGWRREGEGRRGKDGGVGIGVGVYMLVVWVCVWTALCISGHRYGYHT